jgi:DNA modification methylase
MENQLQIEYVETEELKPFVDNPRAHSERNIGDIARSIKRFGWTNPIIVRRSDNMIVAGHGRVEAAQNQGLEQVPVIYVDMSENDAKLYSIADNRTAETSEWDFTTLTELLKELNALPDVDIDDSGFDSTEIEELDQLLANIDTDIDQQLLQGTLEEIPRPKLVDKFIVPPFSVLDARAGYWQTRKREWLNLGVSSELGRGANLCYQIRSELGRGANLLQFSDTVLEPDPEKRKQKQLKKQQVEAELGHEISTAEFQEKYYTGSSTYASGTSVFDPVLCELAYRWFCPDGGGILDPFAGGSIRGVVAEMLGYKYCGIELRAEQVEENRRQAEALSVEPEWIVEDSSKIEGLVKSQFDLIFSCPPYYDLEVYSELEGELSAFETYGEFLEVYRNIVTQTVAFLNDNRFACFVVGDIRDQEGIYRNFVSDTIQAFTDAGMKYYNEMILVQPVGSLAIRINNQFQGYRKVGKAHQNVLVFYKGNVKDIKQEFPELALDYELSQFDKSDPEEPNKDEYGEPLTLNAPVV